MDKTMVPSDQTAFFPETWLRDETGQIAPVRISRHRQGAIVTHSHGFDEFVLVHGGTGIHETVNEAYQLEAGHCFFIPKGQHHGFSGSNDMVITNVDVRHAITGAIRNSLRPLPGYDEVFSADPSVFIRPRRLETEELRELAGLTEKLGRESRRLQEGAEIAVRALLTLLFITVCRYAASTPKQGAAHRQLDRVIRLLEDHFNERITLAEMATMACMTVRSLQRHFLAVTGLTPTGYLMRIRMNHAVRLLAETNRPINRIAGDCGFNDTSYFIHCFQKSMQIPPGAYRRQRREKY